METPDSPFPKESAFAHQDKVTTGQEEQPEHEVTATTPPNPVEGWYHTLDGIIIGLEGGAPDVLDRLYALRDEIYGSLR
jgi:hypothetical protein